MWRHVDGRMVHGVSMDRNAFIFRVKNYFLTSCAEGEGHTMLLNAGRYSSSNTASRHRKPESSHTFVLSLHTKTWDWSFFPVITAVDVIFLSTKWKWLGRSVQALVVFYSSDISRWPLSWPHVSAIIIFIVSHVSVKRTHVVTLVLPNTVAVVPCCSFYWRNSVGSRSSLISMFGFLTFMIAFFLMPMLRPFVTGSYELVWDHLASESAFPTLLLLRTSLSAQWSSAFP